MSSLPVYNADENLFSISMDKNQKFILVEGPFDLPIYEEIVNTIYKKYSIEEEKIITFGGGKQNIIEWASQEHRNNVSIIFDMDFDYGNYSIDTNNVFELRKYSIENYFFDMDVIAPLLSSIFRVKTKDIKDTISLNDLIRHWDETISELTPVIFYYQKHYNGDKEKWTKVFVCQDKNFSICSGKIQQFKSRLLEEMGVTEETCNNYFSIHKPSSSSPDVIFPGKILFTSFYRYLKDTCNNIQDKSFRSFTNPESLLCSLTPRLVNNDDLESIVYSAVVH
ncbi:TPA: DUF4435 domain-containing protein [Photobacterium damselae]